MSSSSTGRRRLKIVIFVGDINPVRVERLSLEALQNGSGFSGTETATMEVAADLARRGHDLVLVVGGDARSQPDEEVLVDVDVGKTAGKTVSVRVTSTASADADAGFFDDVDVYCPLFFLQDPWHLRSLARICNGTRRRKKTAVVWVWMHCFVPDQALHHIWREAARGGRGGEGGGGGGLQVAASFLSPYVADGYRDLLHRFSAHATIGNAVGAPFAPDATLRAEPRWRRGHWAYHAAYERGGRVACVAFDRVRRAGVPEAARQMHLATYYTPDLARDPPPLPRELVTHHGSLSKTGVAALLGSCDYFVYPLALDDGRVHHDTFGSVILEALAMGAIVVTWRAACIPSVYGDHVVYVDPAPLAVPGYDPFARFGSNPRLASDQAAEMLAAKVLELERGDPAVKERIRARGAEWARSQTWQERGGRYEALLHEAVARAEEAAQCE